MSAGSGGKASGEVGGGCHGGGGIGTAAGAAGAADGNGAMAGGVAQPANNNSIAQQQWRTRMEWILLEAAVALGLGLFIAWWLMRGKK